MAKYVINIVADIEEIFLNSLRTHLVSEVHFKDIFSNFGNVRVSGVHPFAILMEQQLSGSGKVPVNLFPSVTLIENTDGKNPALMTAMQYHDNVKIAAAEVADIVANRDKYIISNTDLTALQGLTGGSAYVWATGMVSYIRGSFVAELWSENLKVKSRLYDIVRNFILGVWKRTLNETYDIKLSDDIKGEKSGIYNYDFGKILYGAILRFDADYTAIQYIADTTLGEVAGVTHTEEDVKHSG